MGQRGRGDRGLDRHGPHDRRQGRPSAPRHHRPVQHHPGRRRDRPRPRRRSPSIPRRRLRPGGRSPRRTPRISPRPRGILNRAIVIHGHFYQPPRENPWLESVEVQDSAAPFHDWNERVTAECYAPNTAARRVDEQNRVLDIVNNFEKISFNIGPTLFAWLERHRPDVYAKIIEADRASVDARGHGNACGQVFNHMIMPLATRRDKVTQVRWGIDDFRARFGREPEGLWLPETAVDNESLEVLAEAGVKFTILAPHQALRVRPLDAEAWEDGGGGIDPSRAYRWRGPRAAQPGRLLLRRPHLARDRLRAAARARREPRGVAQRRPSRTARTWPQLVHCATDGETYGHHSRFGEMALAAAVSRSKPTGTATLTNYGGLPGGESADARGRDPRADLVELRPRHRALALRLRLPHARRLAPALAGSAAGSARLAARPDRPLLRGARLGAPQGPVGGPRRLRRGAPRPESGAARRVLRRSRAAASSTPRRASRRAGCSSSSATGSSCTPRAAGSSTRSRPSSPCRSSATRRWRSQYLNDLGGGRLEDEFVRRLAAAPSNVPEMRDGAEVYRRLIRPAAVDLSRVVAHYAITGLLDEYPADARIYAYRCRAARRGARDGRRHDPRRRARARELARSRARRARWCTRSPTSAATTSRAASAPGTTRRRTTR